MSCLILKNYRLLKLKRLYCCHPQKVSPKKRRGRLIKRFGAADSESDHSDSGEKEQDVDKGERASKSKANAFDVMKRKAADKTRLEMSESDRREAKAMFEEAAEESDDEYAGLGGQSDEEDDNAHSSEFEDMIDDDADDNANEREVAELYK